MSGIIGRNITTIFFKLAHGVEHQMTAPINKFSYRSICINRAISMHLAAKVVERQSHLIERAGSRCLAILGNNIKSPLCGISLKCHNDFHSGSLFHRLYQSEIITKSVFINDVVWCSQLFHHFNITNFANLSISTLVPHESKSTVIFAESSKSTLIITPSPKRS